jgi:hypothetical protein
MKEWYSRNSEKQRQQREIWTEKHPNYLKERKNNMKGISAGFHNIKSEMYELSSSEEKLSCPSKDVSVECVPQTGESRLIKAPIVKRFEGVDLAVVSELDKNIYREIDETMRKESVSKRDEW